MPFNLTAFEPNAQLSRDIWTISRLNRETRAVLEGSFPLLWVQGELSNLAQPSSGHIYFTLKDEAAQVRAAMFRPSRLRLRFRPENGQQVLVRGRISLYEARGDFQLLVEHMEPAGEGLWRLELERLKQRLAAEGLFDEAAKRPLPAFPRQVGLITSPTGAAVRDLLTVFARRLRALPAVIYPVAVQGEAAPAEIVRALDLAAERAECDVLILARGGGAYEDLIAFNDEQVVRAIRRTPIPVVTGIGHEVDVTLADLAADRRGATPSAAAELVCPSAEHLAQHLAALQRRLGTAVRRPLSAARQRLAATARHLRLVHPAARLRQRAQTLDELERRLSSALRERLDGAGRRIDRTAARLQAQSPAPRIAPLRYRTEALGQRLTHALVARLTMQRDRLAELARALDALSPLGTLNRGYAVVTRRPDGALLRRASDAPAGTQIEARLAQGRLTCRVESAEED
jgi:exodeoxyribonuclease VII large subunit